VERRGEGEGRVVEAEEGVELREEGVRAVERTSVVVRSLSRVPCSSRPSRVGRGAFVRCCERRRSCIRQDLRSFNRRERARTSHRRRGQTWRDALHSTAIWAQPDRVRYKVNSFQVDSLLAKSQSHPPQLPQPSLFLADPIPSIPAVHLDGRSLDLPRSSTGLVITHLRIQALQRRLWPHLLLGPASSSSTGDTTASSGDTLRTGLTSVASCCCDRAGNSECMSATCSRA
jgi:hypothetical protein